ncbi:MAG: ferritin-like domain-containing protein [Solirubrobacteraceae bacterium]
MSDDDGGSRRALLSGAGAALAGVGALALAGCGRAAKTGHESVKTVARPIQLADIEILDRLLDLERHTVAAYTAGIPMLTRPDARTAKQFLDEELQHTGELLSLIKAAKGKAPPRAASYDLGHSVDGAGVLALLHGLERAQINAYLDAIPKLAPGPVRAAAASILASDAQHIAILRLAQGLPPVPSAFVTGAE